MMDFDSHVFLTGLNMTIFIILHSLSYLICYWRILTRVCLEWWFRGFTPAGKWGSHCVFLKIVICGIRCTVVKILMIPILRGGGDLCSVYWWDYFICRVDVGICWDAVGHLGGSAFVRPQIFQSCLFQLCSPPSKQKEERFIQHVGWSREFQQNIFIRWPFPPDEGCSLCIYSRNKALFEDSVATFNIV